MTASRGDFQGAPGLLLPAYVGQVGHGLGGFYRGGQLVGWNFLLPQQMGDHLPKGIGGQHW